LQSYLKVLQAENRLLREENVLCKLTVKKSIDLGLIQEIPLIDLSVPEEETKAWPDRNPDFAQLRKSLLIKVAQLCKLHGRALSYEEIIDSWKASHRTWYGTIGNPDTISRRLREMAESEGRATSLNDWLSRPKEGFFFLGPKLIAVLKGKPPKALLEVWLNQTVPSNLGVST